MQARSSPGCEILGEKRSEWENRVPKGTWIVQRLKAFEESKHGAGMKRARDDPQL